MSSANSLINSPNVTESYNNMLPTVNSQIQRITDITNANNAMARLNASEQRDWQERMIRAGNEFSMAEAAKNREWQEYMSNTAHQREIKDLKAAGLNPVLSAMGGSGASVGTGATAHAMSGQGSTAEVDKTGSSAVVGLLGSFLDAQTKLANQQTSAISNLAVADKYTKMQEIVAEMNNMTHLAASKYSADTSYRASKYSSDSATYRQGMSQEHDRFMAQNYPSNIVQSVAAILDSLFGSEKDGGISALGNFVKDTAKSATGLFKKAQDYRNKNLEKAREETKKRTGRAVSWRDLMLQ